MFVLSLLATLGLSWGVLAQAPPEASEIKSYDISDLVRPHRAVNPVLPLPLGSGGVVDEENREEDRYSDPLWEESDIVEMIRRSGPRDEWEQDGRTIDSMGSGLLCARAPQSMQTRIAELLSLLRQRVSTTQLVEIWTVPADRLPAEAGPRLSKAAVETLLAEAGSVCLGVGRGTPGSWFRIAVVRGQSMIAEYDVEVAQESEIADPIVGLFRDGLEAAVRITSAGTGWELQASIQRSSLEDVRIVQIGATSLGNLQLPTFSLMSAEVSGRIEGGGALVLGLVQGAADSWVLVRVGSSAASGSAGAGSHLRLLGTGRVGSLLNERRALPRLVPSRSVVRAPERASEFERIAIEGDQIQDTIRRSFEDTQVDSDELEMTSRQGVMILSGRRAGDLSRKVEGLVQSIMDDALPTRGVEVAVGKVDRETARGLLLGKIDLETVAKGLDGRGRVSVAGGDAFRLLLGRQVAYLADQDVEIAHDARIADPWVSSLFLGTGLTATLHGPAAGPVEIRGEFLSRELVGELTSYDGKSDDVGIIETPRTETIASGMQGSLRLGEWTLLHLAERSSRSDSLVLLARLTR